MHYRMTAIALTIIMASAVCCAGVHAGDLQLQMDIVNPSPGASDLFEQSIALNGGPLAGDTLDDTTGARSSSLANPTPTLDDFFDLSVSLSGNKALVGGQDGCNGATDAGTAPLFKDTTGTLQSPFTNPGPAPTLLDHSGH